MQYDRQTVRVPEWDFRWKNKSIAFRRILSLCVDGLILLYFIGQVEDAVSRESHSRLFVLNIFVLVHYSASPISFGKLIFGLRVFPKGFFKHFNRNILTWFFFVGLCLTELEMPFARVISLIFLIGLIVDKACIIGLHRETLTDRFITKTMVVPREGSDEIPHDFF